MCDIIKTAPISDRELYGGIAIIIQVLYHAGFIVIYIKGRKHLVKEEAVL
jgi:hypothetical protein